VCAISGAEDDLSLIQLQDIVEDLASEFEASPWELGDDERGLNPEQLARERMLSSRIDGLPLRRAVLRSQGAVEGVGVFATREISKGELITCYPGDALIYQPTDGIIFGEHVPETMADPESCFGEWIDYGLAEDDEYALIGIPLLDDDAAYLGHFCNDGACLLEGWNTSQYSVASNQMLNAKHIDVAGLHTATVATRPIRRDEEVLVSYGKEYWLEYNERHSNMSESDAIPYAPKR
jgi:hypothetical protein